MMNGVGVLARGGRLGSVLVTLKNDISSGMVRSLCCSKNNGA